MEGCITTPDEFIAWLAPAAQAQCECYDLPASVLIAQGALESGWGRYIIGKYNIFGRKAADGDAAVLVKTTEFYDGQETAVFDNFKLYTSIEEACDDWCSLITQEPVYADAWSIWYTTKDLEEFVRALGPVYATDPEYADKILSTIDACNLTQYDEAAE